MRKGMGKGRGKGYKNIVGVDSRVHSMSAKGIKTAQKLNPVVLNLNKYKGKWYEVARLPNWFQEGCNCAIAEYIKKKGYIEVKNSCLRDGERDFRIAKAYKTEGRTDSLDVYFNPFIKGDYKVLHVDKDYQTAVVSTPDKKLLWFLSRKPTISQSKLNKLKQIAKQNGITDLRRLEFPTKKC